MTRFHPGCGESLVDTQTMKRAASPLVGRRRPARQPCCPPAAAIDALVGQLEASAEARRLAHLGMWTWDAATQAMEWSPELFDILGADPDEVVPSPEAMAGLLDPADGDEFAAAGEECVRSGQPVAFTGRVRRGDGRVVWVEFQLGPLIVGGEVTGLLGTARDVTEWQDARLVGRRADDRFLALVRQASDLIVVLDARGRISLSSPSVERLFGWSPGGVIGARAARFVHPGDLARVRSCLVGVTEPGSTGHVDCRIRTAGGDYRSVEAVFTNLLDDPAVAGYVLNIRDTTQSVEAEARLRSSERRYRTIVETAEEGIWRVGECGECLFANQRMATILGCSLAELQERRFFDFVPDPDQREAVRCQRARLQAGSAMQLDLRMQPADGQAVWVIVSASAVSDAAGQPDGWLAMMTDITARKETEEQLRRSQRQLTEAQRLSRTGSWDRDLVTGTVSLSDEYVELMGAPGGIPDQPFGLIVNAAHPADRDRLARIRDRAIARGTREHLEFRVVHPDGSIRVMRAAIQGVHAPDGTPLRVAGAIQDITEQRALEEQLKQQALQDLLTGLPNRALFVDRLGHALRRRQRTGEPAALLFIDLDDFKTVNDSLGHSAGDAILVSVASRLTQALRPADTTARFGGDEFAILLEGADAGAAALAAQRLLDVLQGPFLIQGREVGVEASIGIAVAEREVEPEQLLRDADAAMYAAKALPRRPRYRVFEPSMHLAARRRLDLRAGLERALNSGEFEVYYQPIVRLGSPGVAGVEALVRWNHPVLGLIPPAEFIPLAEQSGLILPIGEQVLRDATCTIAEVNRARAARPLYLSVNLSPRQLIEPGFSALVDEVLAVSGLDPARLVLEVTESVLVEDQGGVVPVLGQLRERGMRVAVDDFGTGYSSLSYLRRLPLDVLKIDREFVTGVARSPEDAAVAHAIVTLARVLGLSTIAEGIETPEQAAALAAAGCMFGQGFLYGRPVPVGQFIEELAAIDLRATGGVPAPGDERHWPPEHSGRMPE
jgi:diguanylate cyclase (GGDEF)-like protein/PAS domain S-box-containing protein